MDIKHIEQTFSEVSKTTGWAVDKRIALAVTNIYLSRGQGYDEKNMRQQLIPSKRMRDGLRLCVPICFM
ncbi:hypothetical protein A1A1_10331 [Planococcus antarcticus DSM 14505]|uniref:Uncharacterized protein n=1 Tax=Planococcus antarcticus DSM 14505 TaxID=1185653 RepID=A0A1C7DBQ7_9BACL|nr:hypothetical protein [Planococcus antarcticus]ANU08929.1 hypothetical protein BBH88_00550 [Planococcus antarcticus DSM 14505]EIM06540.1 hypothetical protein A1A1_10331 [Planococcus antarcticus DSM 14505]